MFYTPCSKDSIQHRVKNGSQIISVATAKTSDHLLLIDFVCDGGMLYFTTIAFLMDLSYINSIIFGSLVNIQLRCSSIHALIVHIYYTIGIITIYQEIAHISAVILHFISN